MRLDTLIRLRWLAVCGQLAGVLVVHFGLEFEVPIWACLAVIALAALLNVALRVSFRQTQWLEPDRAAWLLTFDIAELAALLYLTGGLENPFAFLLLGPVLISATALPPRMTLLIGTFAMFCATMLVFLHYDLPWDAENPLELPEIYMVGVWLSILLAIGYIGVYTWQVAEEARQLSDALAATELVLGPRAASLPARRACGGGSARARHAAVDHYGRDPRDRTRPRKGFALRRRRQAFARAGPALP